jgi:hypothetical protein
MFQQARAPVRARARSACSPRLGLCEQHSALATRAALLHLGCALRLTLAPRVCLQRKPSVTKEWQQKLPDFVRRLEEALYRSAATKARGAAPRAASASQWAARCALAGRGSARRARTRKGP